MRNTARQFPELISSQPSFPQLGKNPGTGVEILVYAGFISRAAAEFVARMV
jgi:hypothetical protein